MRTDDMSGEDRGVDERQSRSRARTPARFDVGRVTNVVVRAAIIAFESQGFPATGLAIGVIEAAFFSTGAAYSWAACLLLYTALILLGVGSHLDLFSAMTIARAAVISIYICRNNLLADNRFARAVARWCTIHTALMVSCLLVTAAGVLVRAFRDPVENTFAWTIVSITLVYASVRWYKYYLAQGGARVRTLVGAVKLKDVRLAMVTIVLCLAAVEVVVRTCFSQTRVKPTGLYRPHPFRIFDLAPNAIGVHENYEYSVRFKTNAQGLKDFELYPKTPETFRVLCVGDSFTMGDGLTVGQTYPKQLDRMLKEDHPDVSISVVNFGVSSYGTIQELSKLQEDGFALEPDLVILQIYPENDIRDNLRYFGKFFRSAEAEHHRNFDRAQADSSLAARLTRFCRSHSHAFTLVNDRWQILVSDTKLFSGSNKKPRKYRTIEHRPWWLETSLKEYYPEVEEGWRVTEDAIRQIRDLCASRNVVLYAYEAPAKYEFTEDMAQARIGHTGANMDLYDFSTNWRRTTEILERLEIPQIDLRAELMNTGNPQAYYWELDAHMNPVGAEFIAEVLKPVVWEQYCEWERRVRNSES